jgi:hypothetical protein
MCNIFRVRKRSSINIPHLHNNPLKHNKTIWSSAYYPYKTIWNSAYYPYKQQFSIAWNVFKLSSLFNTMKLTVYTQNDVKNKSETMEWYSLLTINGRCILTPYIKTPKLNMTETSLRNHAQRWPRKPVYLQINQEYYKR